MLMIFLVVLLALASAFGEETRIECPEDNLEYGNNWHDVLYYVASWEECGQICARTTKCNFWSWGKAEQYPNECFLHETGTGIAYNDQFISGERGCPEEHCS